MNTPVANPLALTTESDSFTATAVTLTTDSCFTKPRRNGNQYLAKNITRISRELLFSDSASEGH